MTKNEAIQIINEQLDTDDLNNHNTHFANLNSSKDVWWFDIPTKKAFTDRLCFLYLVIYHSVKQELYHLKIPIDFFKKNRSKFIIREAKDTVSLELSANRSNFLIDVRPGSGKVSFLEFLQ